MFNGINLGSCSIMPLTLRGALEEKNHLGFQVVFSDTILNYWALVGRAGFEPATP